MLKNFGVLIILAISYALVPFSVIPYYWEITFLLLIVFIFFFVNRVIFKALNHSELFAGIQIEDNPKYMNSTLTKVDLKEFKLSLERIIQKLMKIY